MAFIKLLLLLLLLAGCGDDGGAADSSVMADAAADSAAPADGGGASDGAADGGPGDSASGDAGMADFSLEDIGSHGQVYSSVAASGPVLLCFHGSGGGAVGWTRGDRAALVSAMRAAGYSIVCPTSLDRVDAHWSPVNGATNPDVSNVDALLDTLGIAPGRPLFLVGHSNGGGFTTRYALLSSRRGALVAIQNSNAAGLTSALAMDAYTFPTLFAYAECDMFVLPSVVRRSIATLMGRGIPVREHLLDDLYAAGDYDNCHEFADTSAVTVAFFASPTAAP